MSRTSLSILLIAAMMLAATVVSQETSSDGFVRRGSASLSSLAAVSSFSAYGISQGVTMKYTKAEGRWIQAPQAPPGTGEDASVAISCNGDVWVLSKAGKLRRQFEGLGAWNNFDGPSPWSAFAVGAGSDVWAVDASGKPFFFKDNAWTATDAVLTKIAVSCDGQVWGITGAGNLWQRDQGNGTTWREVAQGVKDVAVGTDMYVVDTDNNLYKWVAAAGGVTRQVRDMTNMNKKVSGVSTSKDGALWVLDLSGNPEQHTGLIAEVQLSLAERAALEAKQGGRWVDVPDGDQVAPRSVAMRGDGDLWKIGADGIVKFRLAGDGNVWTSIAAPVDLAQIAVGCDGQTIWAVSSAASGNNAYRYMGNGQWNLFSEKLTRVAVGSGARQVWGINLSGQLVYFNPDSTSFEVQPGSGFTEIAAGCLGEVLVVSAEGKLFQRSVRNSNLRYRGDDVKRVAVGGRNKIYILDSRNFLFRYRRPRDGFHEGKANWSLEHKQLIDLAVDSRGQLAGQSVAGQVVRFFRSLQDPKEFGWRAVGGSLDSICMGSASSVFGLDKGVVLRYTPAKTWAVVLGVTLRSITCGCDGTVYGMKGPGIVYRYRSAQIGWERIPNSFMISSIAAGKPGELWGVSHSGEPMRFDPTTNQWSTFKGDLAQISISCEGDLWGVDSAGVVWQHDEQTGNWAKMGVGAKQVATGRGVYVVGTKDTLFKYDPERKTDRWVELGPLREVAAGDDGAVWGIARSGRVVVINEGSTVAPGPELPPTPISDPSAGLPPPEPDQASLSTFQPGQEPELGEQDDIVKRLAAARRMGYNTRNEGADLNGRGPSDDPEPFGVIPGAQQQQGFVPGLNDKSDPDNPDARPANFRPTPFQYDARDPAVDRPRVAVSAITSPIDASNPEPGSIKA